MSILRKAFVIIFCAMTFTACAENAITAITYSGPAQKACAGNLRQAVDNLFKSYESKQPGEFISGTSQDFRLADNSASAYRMNSFEQALRDDFMNLNEPRFQGVVDAVTFSNDKTLATVRVDWSRRTRVALSNEEWLVVGQHSNLNMRSEAGAWRLWSIEGDPMFGLSRTNGTIPLDRGTVAGATAAGSIENGRVKN